LNSQSRPREKFMMIVPAMALLIPGLLLASASGAQDTRTVDVRGSIEGTVDGSERSWLTLSGEMEGDDLASAVWSQYSTADDPMGGALAALPEAQRDEMIARMEMMEEMSGDGPNPMAGMMEAMGMSGGNQITVRIVGFDPDADRILRQGVLSIELPPLASDDMQGLLNRPHSADISYNKNFGDSRGFHVSAHAIGTEATVSFEQLDINDDDSGFALGQFEATLCPLSVVMNQETDSDECLLAAGEFSTELTREDR
jgi:hypothetical protein